MTTLPDTLGMAVVIIRCTCGSIYQDHTYGKRKRVHNKIEKEPNKYRCTVCANVKGTGRDFV